MLDANKMIKVDKENKTVTVLVGKVTKTKIALVFVGYVVLVLIAIAIAPVIAPFSVIYDAFQIKINVED